MIKKYHILLFYLIFAAVLLGLEYVGQAMGLLPKRTFSGNLSGTAIAGLICTILFAIWARLRQKKSGRPTGSLFQEPKHNNP
jgi:uncharacterized membrane protein YccC